MAEQSKSDLIVIGAGPGGYPAAFLAADMGMQVTLIDPEPNPGGVCLFRGCIPTKTLLHFSNLIHETRESADRGLSFGSPEIDLEKMRDWKNRVIGQLTEGMGRLCKQRGIEYIRGTARFRDSEHLVIQREAGENEIRSFRKAVIATGSRPASIPSLPDSPRIMNSARALELEHIPESLLVVGGGYIGLEMGSIYAALGSKVTVVEMMPSILPGADSDLVRLLSMSLRKSFESIRVNTRVEAAKELQGGIEVILSSGSQTDNMEFEQVLVTVGRIPNSEGLGLENTKIAADERGFILVDPMRKTAEPHIYAIGDVVGGAMLAHKATAEGRRAAENIMGKGEPFEPAAVPAVLFTDPEVTWTGMTENEARQKGISVQVGKFMWAASGRAASLGRSDGLTKIIGDAKTETVLGVGIVGPGAGELIGEASLAVEHRMKVSDIANTIHPHPTLSETIMEAAEAFYGLCTHQMRPRK
ncbi:MAG TPA: dihydrolipoyl dehydrogenase [bacterium]|nr:dihydrolipoyl dehydrogenase [bacterium]